jgi:hypothetical protein
MNKTLIGLMAIGLLFGAGSAAAVEGSLGGTYGTGVDANAHADYSGVLGAVGDARSQAQGAADAAVAAAGAAIAKGQAEGQRSVDASVSASTDAKSGLLQGVTGNLRALGDWFGGLWVKPTVDAKHAEDMTASGDLLSQVQQNDGKLDAYYGQDLQSTARVDYNVPPPPTPSVGFLGDLQMAFQGLLHIE